MSYRWKYCKRDKNHVIIKKKLLELGWSVTDTFMVGQDFPDMVAGKAGITHLIEVKSEGGKLSPGQVKFQKTWLGAPVAEIRNEADCLALDALITGKSDISQ